MTLVAGLIIELIYRSNNLNLSVEKIRVITHVYNIG